jgi:hypothetical protein
LNLALKVQGSTLNLPPQQEHLEPSPTTGARSPPHLEMLCSFKTAHLSRFRWRLLPPLAMHEISPQLPALTGRLSMGRLSIQAPSPPCCDMHTPMSVRSMGLTRWGNPRSGPSNPTNTTPSATLHDMTGSGPHALRRTAGRRTRLGLLAVSWRLGAPVDIGADKRTLTSERISACRRD